MKEILINAVNAQGSISTTVSNPLGISSIGQIVGLALNFIIGIGWAIAFIYLALGFMAYITSSGEKDKTQEAQKKITFAIIGAVGLLILGAVRGIITNLLGDFGFTEFLPDSGK